MKKYFISFLLIVGILFVNISGVNAVNVQGGGSGSDPNAIETQDGYAKCVYAGYGKIYPTIQVVIRVYKDTDGVVRSYAEMMCAKKGEESLSHCDIANYDDIFHHADTQLYDKFHDNNGWKCANDVYAYTGNASKIYLSIGQKDGATHLKLVDDESEIVNEDDESFNSDSDYEDVIDVDDKYDDNDNSGGSVDTSVIMDWANIENEYDLGDVGDPCSIINTNLKNLLSNVFWFISIAGIILVVVMTAISFIKAIVGSDDEKFKTAFSHLITRLIVVFILLLLPMFLTFIINIINDNMGGTVKVGADGDVFCDITK